MNEKQINARKAKELYFAGILNGPRYTGETDADYAQKQVNIRTNAAHSLWVFDQEVAGKWIGHGCTNDSGKVQGVEFSCYVGSLEEAQRIAGQFPKLCKVRVYRVCRCDESKDCGIDYAVNFRASFSSNVTTGVANETSIKRAKKFLSLFPAVGKIVWDNSRCRNGVTYEALLAVLEPQK